MQPVVNWLAGGNWLTPVTTLVAAFGGYVLAGRNEESRDERAWEREREARKAEREAREADDARERERRQHDFQLQTLLALQRAVVDFGRVKCSAPLICSLSKPSGVAKLVAGQ